MSHTTLVLVHGRAQQRKDPEALRRSWIDALRIGLGAERSKILDNIEIVLPFYGDSLDRFLIQLEGSMPADIIVRGDGSDIDERYRKFHADVVSETAAILGITQAQVDLFLSDEVRQRGPLNWSWVQSLLRAVDMIPGVSAHVIERCTRDVYAYLSITRVRNDINTVVERAIPAGRTVILGHSLGSVVAYDVLRGSRRRYDVPLFMTVGSPLGVGPIRRTLAPLLFPPGVKDWYNAFDPRDVVALHPLDTVTFAVQPPIKNYGSVRNCTENAHGIDGYLSDPQVAGRLYEAFS